jgi:hypothetical protein
VVGICGMEFFKANGKISDFFLKKKENSLLIFFVGNK